MTNQNEGMVVEMRLLKGVVLGGIIAFIIMGGLNAFRIIDLPGTFLTPVIALCGIWLALHQDMKHIKVMGPIFLVFFAVGVYTMFISKNADFEFIIGMSAIALYGVYAIPVLLKNKKEREEQQR